MGEGTRGASSPPQTEHGYVEEQRVCGRSDPAENGYAMGDPGERRPPAKSGYPWGAKPSSIVAMIVQENVALTSLAGVSGLIAGFGALSLSSPLFNDPTSIMSAPFVELNVAVWATVADEDDGITGQLLRLLGVAGTTTTSAADAAAKWSEENELGLKSRAVLE